MEAVEEPSEAAEALAAAAEGREGGATDISSSAAALLNISSRK
jgi:hypothetical protein